MIVHLKLSLFVLLVVGGVAAKKKDDSSEEEVKKKALRAEIKDIDSSEELLTTRRPFAMGCSSIECEEGYHCEMKKQKRLTVPKCVKDVTTTTTKPARFPAKRRTIKPESEEEDQFTTQSFKVTEVSPRSEASEVSGVDSAIGVHGVTSSNNVVSTTQINLKIATSTIPGDQLSTEAASIIPSEVTSTSPSTVAPKVTSSQPISGTSELTKAYPGHILTTIFPSIGASEVTTAHQTPTVGMVHPGTEVIEVYTNTVASDVIGPYTRTDAPTVTKGHSSTEATVVSATHPGAAEVTGVYSTTNPSDNIEIYHPTEATVPSVINLASKAPEVTTTTIPSPTSVHTTSGTSEVTETHRTTEGLQNTRFYPTTTAAQTTKHDLGSTAAEVKETTRVFNNPHVASTGSSEITKPPPSIGSHVSTKAFTTTEASVLIGNPHGSTTSEVTGTTGVYDRPAVTVVYLSTGTQSTTEVSESTKNHPGSTAPEITRTTGVYNRPAVTAGSRAPEVTGAFITPRLSEVIGFTNTKAPKITTMYPSTKLLKVTDFQPNNDASGVTRSFDVTGVHPTTTKTPAVTEGHPGTKNSESIGYNLGSIAPKVTTTTGYLVTEVREDHPSTETPKITGANTTSRASEVSGDYSKPEDPVTKSIPMHRTTVVPKVTVVNPTTPASDIKETHISTKVIELSITGFYNKPSETVGRQSSVAPEAIRFDATTRVLEAIGKGTSKATQKNAISQVPKVEGLYPTTETSKLPFVAHITEAPEVTSTTTKKDAHVFSITNIGNGPSVTSKFPQVNPSTITKEVTENGASSATPSSGIPGTKKPSCI